MMELDLQQNFCLQKFFDTLRLAATADLKMKEIL